MASGHTYGYRRIHAALLRLGVQVCADTVHIIIGTLGLKALCARRKIRTTTPDTHRGNTREDLVQRDFTADHPGQKWVGDITYIHTQGGMCYLATVLDCATRKIIGWAMADHMRADLVCDALDKAIGHCPGVVGETIFHSDRGSQYTSEQFQALLNRYGIRPSVGETGVCWDNAWAESVNATVKVERVHHMLHQGPGEAKADPPARWIELVYNQTRLHYEVEQEYMMRQTA